MGDFIGQKFGIPIKFSSRYNTVPYTALDWRLVHEDDDEFIAIHNGNIVIKSKKHYNYKVIDKT